MIAFSAAVGERARIIYAGPDLPGATVEELVLLGTRQHAPGTSTVPIEASLSNAIGTGISGASALTGHRAGRDWAIDLRVSAVEHPSLNALTIHCEDARAGLSTQHTFVLDPETGMLTANTATANHAEGIFDLEWCAALCLPFDARLSRFLSFTGRWAGEFSVEEVPYFQGSILRENKAGRTSHDAFPGGILAAPDAGEMHGQAAAFHLAWSGNHRLRIDRHSDARAFMQIGELFFPGEIRLAKGESYQSPDCLIAWSNQGLNAASHAFHDYALGSVLDARNLAAPRPVHYNTWEAVYFNHDEAVLMELAEAAANVGAERFVLDDGWFGARRHDGAGLGDWFVSSDVYPNGLQPIADRVRELGMEFGLWFEPEMVNPDSDLFRAHPDWVLGVEGVEPIPFRGQLTLDLTRGEVCDYLFERISALVTELGVAYIKWDMNRDANHPGSGGVAIMHRQTRALYALIERLRAAHRALEIESCASGGDRIWTSDNNDARERQVIQRGASHFLPLRILGSHVGPARCHITGHQFPMHFRVASAVFGHMGMELDLRDESEEELAVLRAGIALYKRHRALIHSGQFWRLDAPLGTNLIGCVARDQREGLFSFAKLGNTVPTQPQRIHFRGLDPALTYRVQMVWPSHNPSISAPSIMEVADLQGDGLRVSGAALMGYGIQPPLTFPDTALFFHLQASN